MAGIKKEPAKGDIETLALARALDGYALAELALDGTVTFANPKFLELVGYPADELVGANHDRLLTAEDLDSACYHSAWSELRAGRSIDGEYRRITRDGHVVWLRGAYTPVTGPNGETRIVHHAADITAEKVRQADFAGQVAAIGRSQAVIEFDMAGVVLAANQNFLDAFGYEAAEVVGRHHRLFVDEATSKSDAYARFWEGLRRGEFTTGEYRRLGKDGREVWIQATYNPIFDLDGRPYKVVKYASDTTEAKMISANFQGQIEAIQKSQAVIEFDLNGYILAANQNFLDVIGYELSDIVGRHHREVVYAEEYGLPAYDAFWRSLRAGEFRSGEFRRRHKLGHEIWLQASYTPIRDLAGRPYKIVKFATDITEAVQRKKREGELEAARLAAEASAKAKSDFLANMSHELRTPLTSILGFSRLIGRDGTLSPSDREYLDLIRDAGETLLRVVNDILDFSKLEAGNVVLTKEPFATRSLIDGVAHLLSTQAAEKGLSLTATVDEGVLNGDAPRLRQVLLNLVNNAIKFTDKGGVSITSTLTPADEGQSLFEVRVTDTGMGLSPENVARLFKRFSQANEGLNRRHGGTGLGLAISRLLVGAMGGEIGVESAEGVGSTFWFRIPLAAGGEVVETSEDDASVIDRPVRILMADDHFANRKLVQTLLEPFGVEMACVEDGVEAVAAAQAGPFDIILMDMQMPNMDGVTASQNIRASNGPNAKTPIIALTANILPEHKERCLAAGMQGHLSKPIDPNALIETINRYAFGGDEAGAQAA